MSQKNGDYTTDIYLLWFWDNFNVGSNFLKISDESVTIKFIFAPYFETPLFKVGFKTRKSFAINYLIKKISISVCYGNE